MGSSATGPTATALRVGGFAQTSRSPPPTVRAPTTVSASDVDACVASSTPTTGESMNVSSTATESSANAARWCCSGHQDGQGLAADGEDRDEEQAGEERRAR